MLILVLCPLTTNDFNRAKSNLKFLEYAAGGIAAIGTTFTDGTNSPYYDIPVKLTTETTIEEIDATVKMLCNKDNFNKTIKDQYDYLKANNHWLESKGYIDRFLKVINGIPV